MLGPVASNADYIIAIISACLAADMLPTVWHQFRAKTCSIPLVSSVVTFVCLAGLGVVYLALGLYFSVAMATVTAAVWAVSAAQRVAYGAPQKEE